MFDDGYKDNIEYAAPILRQFKCPASFYVVTDCIDRNVPTWTYRFAATGPALSASSTHALFISTGVVAQLNWNPKSPTPLLLTFDSKGVITAADSAPSVQKELISLLISKELGLLALTSSTELVSIFTPNPR